MEHKRNVCGNQRQFLLECMNHGTRQDHRSHHQCRRLNIELGAMLGSCVVSLGDTKVGAAVTYALVEPSSETPNQGLLEFFVVLSPLADPSWNRPLPRNHPLGLQIMSAIERSVKGSGALDPSLLVIVPGRTVGSLRVDVTVLHHDGNLVDCSVLAAYTALRHFRKPEVSVKNGEVTLHKERDPIPFSLGHMPLSISFGIVGGKHIVADPTNDEKSIINDVVHLSVNSQGELCGLYKLGGTALNQTVLERCASIAHTKAIRWHKHVTAVLAGDEAERKALFRKQFEWAKQRVGVGKEDPPAAAVVEALRPTVQTFLDDVPDEETKGKGLKDDDDDDDDSVEPVVHVPTGVPLQAERVGRGAMDAWDDDDETL